ncbi:nuclear export factor GLE1 [Rhodoferax lacus]|uniref:Nuclear export factor GLE1 n=1 Tax=Rhodoferax lacus TaxID=2184758 RepID=A0A3E1R7E0_9BURK|nr:YcnI family protein [Rhodoferax lacus]RFO95163.1 nuclear export factor GLE1 [Rhodoferax lacus]
MKSVTPIFAACAVLLAASAAQSHVVLQDAAAAAGASYRAAFRVGHGCEGAATTGIRVRIPEGFQGTKPMPKPGWTLTTTSARLAKPYDSHGKTITEDVVEVSWTANGKDNALPEAWYDEFVLRGTTPAQGGPLWFKVLQTCENAQNDWSQTPSSGTSTKGLKAPAALLEVIDSGASAAHAH